MRIEARHYRTQQVLDLTIEQGCIAASPSLQPTDHPTDLPWVAPALFDLQINGCMGKGFVDPTLTFDDLALIVATCQRHGIAAFCPTLITASQADLLTGFALLRRAREQSLLLAAAMPCFHLEGPYLSGEDGPRGAHPRAHIRPPSEAEFAQLQEAAGGAIRLVTLAPEWPEALGFIERRVAENVVVALGHTAATPARIREAVAAGARLSTHLGNGSHAVLPRHDNYLWEQLADDRLTASVIADGHHLPDAVLRVMLRTKRPGRLILTCDASSLAGLPPGRYAQWGTELDVLPKGKVVVPGTPFLAGSGVLLDSCLRHLEQLGEWPLADLLDAAGAQPRALLRLPPREIAVGAPADLMLYRTAPFRIVQVFLAGKPILPEGNRCD
jgi:N-acetylglucosamine-6-phosphate deacetylase